MADDKKGAASAVDLGVLKEVIGFRIRRIQNHISRTFAESHERKEVRPGVFSALALIGANPGISQIALAGEAGFNEATVVSLLDTLEGLGWAERRRAPEDRRRSALFITDEGSVALTRLLKQAVANEALIKARLTETERAQLFHVLDKIYAECCGG